MWQEIFSPILLRPTQHRVSQERAVSIRNIDRTDPNYAALWNEVAFVCIGTVAAELAVKCCVESPSFQGSQILLATTLNDESNELNEHVWLNFFTQKALKYVIVMEDDVGALYNHCVSNYAKLQGRSYLGTNMPCLQFLSRRITNSGPSQRTLKSCLHYFGFTVQHVEEMYRKRKRQMDRSVS